MFLAIISPCSSCSSYSWNEWSVGHFCFHNHNNTMTFLGVRFYIDFEVSLVDKRFKGFRDCAKIISRGRWKWAWHRVILRGAPHRLTFACSLFILYCNVFRRVRLKNYLKTTRWGKANHFRTVGLRIVSWILLWITGLSFESFASLRHRFRLFESWPERTKLRTRANSLYFPPRPLLRHVCHVIELGRYSRIPLFKQCLCLLRFTWHFLSAENVFNLNVIIIHSKNFPNSDWLKAHA